MTRLRAALPVAAAVLLAGLAQDAGAVLAPNIANVAYQTNGRSHAANQGDWYTNGGTASTDPIHRILVEITAAQLTSCGGTCDIVVVDAESTGALDDVNNASDPTRFSLRARDGVTVLQGPVTFASGTADGTNHTFTVTAVGVYQVTSETGGFPISGDATNNNNNDDNGFSLDVEQAGGASGGFVGALQSTWVNSGAAIDYDLYFLVGPATSDSALALRNFDNDNDGPVAYTRPGGVGVAGTTSANTVWNGGAGTLDAGEDSATADNAPATAAANDEGVWTLTSSTWDNDQTVFEVNAAGVRLPLADQLPQRAGNFSLSAAGTLCANIGQAVDHSFTVSNDFFTNDIVNLTFSALPANWTASFRDSGGTALTDTDGDGVVDTGILAPEGAFTVLLRVQPDTGALGPYSATISAVSHMDAKVVPGTNTTVTLAKTTYVCPEIQKAFSPATVGVNTNSTLTFTLTNRNSTALTALGFTDAYPAGFVNRTPLTVGGSCAGVTTTAAAGGSSFDVTAGTVPSGAPGSCTITVDVTAQAVGNHSNTTSGASGQFASTAVGPGAVSNTAVLTVEGASLTVVKTSAVISDPVNGSTNPKRLPGAFVDYSVQVTNTGLGAVDTDTTDLIDAIPAGVDLYVGDLGGAGSGPVVFVDGSPISGLSYTFISLASVTDDVSFSNNGGATYIYVPTPDAFGVDSAVTHLRIRPKGVFAGDAVAGAPSPGFTVTFRIRLE